MCLVTFINIFEVYFIVPVLTLLDIWLLSFSHGIISSVRRLSLCAQAHSTGSGLGYKNALRILLGGLSVTFPCYRKQVLNLSPVSSLSVERNKKLGKRYGESLCFIIQWQAQSIRVALLWC